MFTEIDECSLSSSPCGPSSNCQNTPRGSYTCTCENGFSGDPPQVTCVGKTKFEYLSIFHVICIAYILQRVLDYFAGVSGIDITEIWPNLVTE